jgi:hypothetical protein
MNRRLVYDAIDAPTTKNRSAPRLPPPATRTRPTGQGTRHNIRNLYHDIIIVYMRNYRPGKA